MSNIELNHINNNVDKDLIKPLINNNTSSSRDSNAKYNNKDKNKAFSRTKELLNNNKNLIISFKSFSKYILKENILVLGIAFSSHIFHLINLIILNFYGNELHPITAYQISTIYLLFFGYTFIKGSLVLIRKLLSLAYAKNEISKIFDFYQEGRLFFLLIFLIIIFPIAFISDYIFSNNTLNNKFFFGNYYKNNIYNNDMANSVNITIKLLMIAYFFEVLSEINYILLSILNLKLGLFILNLIIVMLHIIISLVLILVFKIKALNCVGISLIICNLSKLVITHLIYYFCFNNKTIIDINLSGENQSKKTKLNNNIIFPSIIAIDTDIVEYTSFYFYSKSALLVGMAEFLKYSSFDLIAVFSFFINQESFISTITVLNIISFCFKIIETLTNNLQKNLNYIIYNKSIKNMLYSYTNNNNNVCQNSKYFDLDNEILNKKKANNSFNIYSYHNELDYFLYNYPVIRKCVLKKEFLGKDYCVKKSSFVINDIETNKMHSFNNKSCNSTDNNNIPNLLDNCVLKNITLSKKHLDFEKIGNIFKTDNHEELSNILETYYNHYKYNYIRTYINSFILFCFILAIVVSLIIIIFNSYIANMFSLEFWILQKIKTLLFYYSLVIYFDWGSQIFSSLLTVFDTDIYYTYIKGFTGFFIILPLGVVISLYNTNFNCEKNIFKSKNYMYCNNVYGYWISIYVYFIIFFVVSFILFKRINKFKKIIKLNKNKIIRDKYSDDIDIYYRLQ